MYSRSLYVKQRGPGNNWRRCASLLRSLWLEPRRAREKCVGVCSIMHFGTWIGCYGWPAAARRLGLWNLWYRGPWEGGEGDGRGRAGERNGSPWLARTGKGSRIEAEIVLMMSTCSDHMPQSLCCSRKWKRRNTCISKNPLGMFMLFYLNRPRKRFKTEQHLQIVWQMYSLFMLPREAWREHGHFVLLLYLGLKAVQPKYRCHRQSPD